MTYDRIIWLDIETTGLDPARDKILEVALILTTPQGEELAACDWQIYQDGACRLADDYVTAMHTASGLWEECAHSPFSEDHADRAISAWLQDVGVSRHTSSGLRLGGRNIGGFDLPFLRQSRLSYSAAHLPYRCLDITSVHAALEAAGYDVDLGGRDGAHRALADLRRDIALYRTYLAALRGE